MSSILAQTGATGWACLFRKRRSLTDSRPPATRRGSSANGTSAPRRFHSQRRGFDEFFGFLGGAHPYFAGQGAPIFRGTEVVQEKEYLTDAFGREAASFVGRHKDQPFLLYLAFNAVHTPMHATDSRLTRFASITDPGRKTYAAMLAAMDEAVGTMLDALKSAISRKTRSFSS